MNHVVLGGTTGSTYTNSGESTHVGAVNATLESIAGSGDTAQGANDTLVVTPTPGGGTPFEYITFSISPSNSSALDVSLGTNSTLHVGSLPTLSAFTIDQSAGATNTAVVFDTSLQAASLNVTATTITANASVTTTNAIGLSAVATGGQTESGTTAATDTISALSINAGITVASGVTLQGSSIALSAMSTTVAAIQTPSAATLQTALDHDVERPRRSASSAP